MARLDERRKRGAEILKKYRVAGTDKYAAAADAIADILLSVTETGDEGSKVLRAAEVDFRNNLEEEEFLAEG